MQLCLVGRLLPGDSRRVRVKKDGRQGGRERRQHVTITRWDEGEDNLSLKPLPSEPDSHQPGSTPTDGTHLHCGPRDKSAAGYLSCSR